MWRFPLLGQIPGPRDCILTGGCPADLPPVSGPASGWMWVAIGLVAVGVIGFVREWRRATGDRLGRGPAVG